MQGMLFASLEPPRIGFVCTGTDESATSGKQEFWRSCTLDELKEFLLEFNAISVEHNWPIRDYVVYLPGRFPRAKLDKFGLIRVHAGSNRKLPANLLA